MEEKLTYKSAMEEIESLVKLLEENKLDVDELSEKVKRMAVLAVSYTHLDVYKRQT